MRSTINAGTIVSASGVVVLLIAAIASAADGLWVACTTSLIWIAIICVIDRLRWPEQRFFLTAALFGEKDEKDESDDDA